MSRSFISSVLSQKCPRCRNGNLFTHGAFNYRKFSKMNDKCPCCGQDLKLEPSFYEGAMYVSYAFQVALFVTVYVAYQMLYPEVGVAVQIGTLVALVLLLFSLILRLSRTLWIHFFIKANPAKAKCSEGQSRAPLPA